MAGDADLMVNMKKKILAPDPIVRPSKISSMHGIEEKEDRVITGGRYTVAELTVDPLVGKTLSTLRSSTPGIMRPPSYTRATRSNS